MGPATSCWPEGHVSLTMTTHVSTSPSDPKCVKTGGPASLPRPCLPIMGPCPWSGALWPHATFCRENMGISALETGCISPMRELRPREALWLQLPCHAASHQESMRLHEVSKPNIIYPSPQHTAPLKGPQPPGFQPLPQFTTCCPTVPLRTHMYLAKCPSLRFCFFF